MKPLHSAFIRAPLSKAFNFTFQQVAVMQHAASGTTNGGTSLYTGRQQGSG